MRRRSASPLTYANVMSTAAAFIALGGVSWAAVTLPKNSVGRAQLKKNSVTTAKIKNGTITKADLAAGVATSGPAGAPGATGAPGPQGATGAVGPQGPAGDPVSRSGLIEGGPRTVASYHLAANASKVITLSPSTALEARLTIRCAGSGANQALGFDWQNASVSKAHLVDFQFDRGSGVAVSNGSQRLGAGTNIGVSPAPSTTPNLSTWYDIHALGDDGTSVHVAIHGASVVGGFDQCDAFVVTQTDSSAPIAVP